MILLKREFDIFPEGELKKDMYKITLVDRTGVDKSKEAPLGASLLV